MRCARCRQDISVTAGTAFHDSHIPLRLWFQAIWCAVSQKHGISALGLSRVLGIKRYATALLLLRKIRSAMVRPGRERLSGTVEADEVFLGGKRRLVAGRTPTGTVMVLIAAEDKGAEGIGRIRMRVIPDATLPTLNAAIKAMVDRGSTVRTDGWKGYQGLGRVGYRHVETKRQPSIPGYDPTPLIHRISSLLKRWLLGTHQGGVRKSHIGPYLEEFVFRFNRRSSRSRGKLFYRLIQIMVHPHEREVV